MNGEKKESVRSVDRTIDVLNAFSLEEPERPLSQISFETGLAKSTVYRILSTLEQHNLVAQNPETGKYYLSYGMIRLGTIAQEGNILPKLAQFEMQKLTQVTDQTCNLYVRDGFERVCIAQTIGAYYVRRYSYLGARYPLYCGAGKVLLAYVDENTWNDFFASVRLERITDNTITTREALEADILKIRRDGYCFSRGERDPSTAMVAVPLTDYTKKVVACLTISGPISYFNEEKTANFLELLRQAAKAISLKLSL